MRVPNEQAFDLFYRSKTFELISEGVADMHCLSDEYLAEEVEREISGNSKLPLILHD